MIRNYLLTALRNLWRSKAFSILNLTGLAVGMASATLILLVIHNEMTFDDFQHNKANLYKVWNRDIVNGSLFCWDGTPHPLGPDLLQEYPAIANMCRIDDHWTVTDAGDRKMSSHMNAVDTSFLSMFTFPMIAGNPATALQSPDAMVVTQSMAKKLFGDKDPMNQSVQIEHHRYKVTGVLKDLPTNSSLTFEFLLPWSYEIRNYTEEADWAANIINTYVQLKPGANETTLNQQIKKTTIRHSHCTSEVFLHPMPKWHLYSDFENGQPAGGRITTITLLAIIAAFILLVACINFMNLSTARSERRAKEVGIRKVSGAYRSMLISQFLGESLLMSILAAILALVLVKLSLPAFDTLINIPLVVPYTNPWFWVSAASFTIITGILAGSYPAFFLSAFKPVSVLKGDLTRSRTRPSRWLGRSFTKKTHAAVNPRKVLVVVQFSFAILLIICTLIVVKQMDYGQNRSAGYERGAMLYHWNTGDIPKNFAAIKRDLLASGVALDVCRTNTPLTAAYNNTMALHWPGKQLHDNTLIDRLSEDQGLVKTAGLQIVAGRDMDLSRYPADSTAMLLNESAVKTMGLKNPIGQLIGDDTLFHVVGVVKNFIANSPYDPIAPMVIEGIKGSYFNVTNIRLSGDRPMTATLDKLREIFARYNPEFPFEYHFVREDYDQKFRDTQQIATLSGLFAGLTIFISCLGLFGLAAYMAEARIKEIGVRKVLGASVFNITTLLTKEFLTLVIISLLIASPIAWFVMHAWLQTYSYRITIDPWVFLLSGSLAILISILTVGGQALAAARANPARSLKI
jgi:ABC-type antimicrobial peptide transport system permease subunit